MSRSVRRMDEAWSEAIGVRIREERERLGLSRKRMADFLVIHEKTLVNYENGRWPGRELQHIAEVLNRDIRWLLHGDEWQDPLDLISKRLAQVEQALALLLTPPASTDSEEALEREQESAALIARLRDEASGAAARKPHP